MRKKYVKASEKSNKSSEKQAAFPAIDMGHLRSMVSEGIEKLSFEVGIVLVEHFLNEDVSGLCGDRSVRNQEREHYRYGSQPGYCYIGGQKTHIMRPRVRTIDGREASLPLYEKIQDPNRHTRSVSRRILCGVSMRNYDEVIDHTAESYGISKSAVSRNFRAATKAELEKIQGRDLGKDRWVITYIDGTDMGGETMIASIGVNIKGEKVVLGFRQGGTENSSVVKELLSDMKERGFTAEQGVLFVIDGSKALLKGIRDTFGKNAFIQRCRIHKKRNVCNHSPRGQQMLINRLLTDAYKIRDIDQAREALEKIARKLENINPDAASSLREGMEATLTVLKFDLPEQLLRVLLTTNPIESMFSVTKTLVRRVKRWRGGDMRKRWIGAGLLRAEKKCNRISGYKHLPLLAEKMKALLNKQKLEKKEAAA